MKFSKTPHYGEIITSTENSNIRYIFNGEGWKIYTENSSDNSGGNGGQSYNKMLVHDSVQETPSGLINGENNCFQLECSPILNSENVYLNGLLQKKGNSLDYIIQNNLIIFNESPLTGSRITCTYVKTAYTEILNETPSGTKDGINQNFSLLYTPIINTEMIYLNGLLQKGGINEDYIVTNNIIIFNEAPLSNSIITCNYKTNGN